jgi:hypothetical protein
MVNPVMRGTAGATTENRRVVVELTNIDYSDIMLSL